MTQLKQNASLSIAGTIYQFYVAVEKCFELKRSEKLFIEKFGDLTISNSLQIEVKMYSDDLTDLHENIWKTISNWLDEKFEIIHYKELILLTTQEFSQKSSFISWNEKSGEQKLEVLESVFSKYSTQKKKDKKTEELVNFVLGNNQREKLTILLEKFSILDSSPRQSDYYEELKEKYAKGVLEANRVDFINSILGYIICPDSGVGSTWEISFDSFTKRVGSLTQQYCSGTKIFPKKYSLTDFSHKEIQEKDHHTFVKKIDEIQYMEVKNSAILDYLRTNGTILVELSKHSLSKNAYDSYEKELLDLYLPQYRKACRNTEKEEIIKKSKDYYDTVTSSPVPNFINFNDTPVFFRNGMLHNLADDELRNFEWKLKEESDE